MVEYLAIGNPPSSRLPSAPTANHTVPPAAVAAAAAAAKLNPPVWRGGPCVIRTPLLLMESLLM